MFDADVPVGNTRVGANDKISCDVLLARRVTDTICLQLVAMLVHQL